MNKENWQTRTELLIGKEQLDVLNKSKVLVAGVGGVGGYAAEQLVRAGIGNLTIIDHDRVHSSNRNRQIVALTSTEKKLKAEVLKDRFLDINHELNLTILKDFLNNENIGDIITSDYDYIVDAIDTITPKINLLHHCVTNKIKVVSSMGAGAKMDPTKIKVADISKSYNCRLASYIRKHLHRRGIYKGFKVVFSSGKPIEGTVQEVKNEQNKRSIVGTISYMPAIFGCFCAYVVINDLLTC